MITDKRLQWLSGPDYNETEPGEIAAELLTARARIAALEAGLRRYGQHTEVCLMQAVLRERRGHKDFACQCGFAEIVVSIALPPPQSETKGEPT